MYTCIYVWIKLKFAEDHSFKKIRLIIILYNCNISKWRAEKVAICLIVEFSY